MAFAKASRVVTATANIQALCSAAGPQWGGRAGGQPGGAAQHARRAHPTHASIANAPDRPTPARPPALLEQHGKLAPQAEAVVRESRGQRVVAQQPQAKPHTDHQQDLRRGGQRRGAGDLRPRLSQPATASERCGQLGPPALGMSLLPLLSAPPQHPTPGSAPQRLPAGGRCRWSPARPAPQRLPPHTWRAAGCP